MLPPALGAQTDERAYASEAIRFDRIGLEQGLSQSTVSAIAQDAHGFMWFGTHDGLNRFDGYKITVFKHHPADSNSISHNTVWALMCDRKGNLWIGTEKGVNCYKPYSNRFSLHPLSPETNQIAPVIASAFCEDSRGTIWIGTSAGLRRYDQTTGAILSFRLPADTSSPLRLAVQAICEDTYGHLWVATTNGLYRIFLHNDSVEYIRQLPGLIGSSVNVRSLTLDTAGVLWIGTWQGDLYSVDTRTNVFVRHASPIKRGSGNIYSMLAAQNGDIWIATFEGVKIYTPRQRRFTRVSTDPAVTFYRSKDAFIWIGTFANGLLVYNPHRQRFRNYVTPGTPGTGSRVGNAVFSILEDHDGALWVGTFGNGLSRYDRRGGHVVTYKHRADDPSSLSNNRIIALCETRPGEIWIGTDGGGVNRLDTRRGRFQRFSDDASSPMRLSHNRVSALYYDSNSRHLWIGYLNGTLDEIDLTTSSIQHYMLARKNLPIVSTSAVTSIVRGPRSGILLGTYRRGLLVHDPASRQFVPYPFPDSLAEVIGNMPVYSVVEQANGTLWMGTGTGLLQYASGTPPVFRHYTTADGLPNNVVYGILTDRSGRFWLSTNKGISRFTPSISQFKNYDISDGLQSDEFNQGAYFASRTGELFFGGVNGFNSFFPDEIHDNALAPPVYITEFKVFNKPLALPTPLPPGQAIELSHAQNFFTFEFVALSYAAPEKNQYAYMLEGFDRGWNYVSARQRYAGYTNLDPGSYILRVKGSNSDGYWNEHAATLTITIRPPFWMTWWFRASGLLLVLGIAASLYHRKITTLEKEKLRQQELSRTLIERQEEERRRIAREMHDSLGQDLLFIKNLALLTLDDSSGKETVREHAARISETASKALKSVRTISHDLRPPELDRLGLSETLRSILLKVRESTSLTLSGEIDDIDGMIRPELEINIVRIIQEALANVIKHAQASECSVVVEKKDRAITISIRDDGRGFDTSAAIGPESSRMPHAATNKPAATYTTIGIGLTGMMERVRMLGGTIAIDSAPGEGTSIHIEVPISADKAKNPDTY